MHTKVRYGVIVFHPRRYRASTDDLLIIQAFISTKFAFSLYNLYRTKRLHNLASYIAPCRQGKKCARRNIFLSSNA